MSAVQFPLFSDHKLRVFQYPEPCSKISLVEGLLLIAGGVVMVGLTASTKISKIQILALKSAGSISMALGLVPVVLLTVSNVLAYKEKICVTQFQDEVLRREGYLQGSNEYRHSTPKKRHTITSGDFILMSSCQCSTVIWLKASAQLFDVQQVYSDKYENVMQAAGYDIGQELSEEEFQTVAWHHAVSWLITEYIDSLSLMERREQHTHMCKETSSFQLYSRIFKELYEYKEPYAYDPATHTIIKNVLLYSLAEHVRKLYQDSNLFPAEKEAFMNYAFTLLSKEIDKKKLMEFIKTPYGSW